MRSSAATPTRTAIVTFCLLTAAYTADTPKQDRPDPVAAGMDHVRLALIPQRLNQFIEQGTAAGFVTLVARHGQIAAFDAIGYQDLEAKTPMRTDSIFRIKSLTKPLTAAGVMILADEARISLLDPV